MVPQPALDLLWERLNARNAAAPSGVFTVTRTELASYNRLFQRPGPDELARYDDHVTLPREHQ